MDRLIVDVIRVGCKNHRSVDLISDALPFGRLWNGEPNAVSNAIGYAKHRSQPYDAVIRVYDEAGNVIETHEHMGELLQRDFAHQLGAQDFANIEAFHLYRLLLIGCADEFSGDRIELFARVILRGHVLRFHHYQDVEVLRCSGVAEQDLVIDN